MGLSSSMRSLIVQDPVIAASIVISLIGVGLPVVVPPIRNALGGTEPIPPPKISEVVQGMTGKKQGSS